MKNVRYLYPALTTRNFGDYVIDYACKYILGQHFPPPVAICDINHDKLTSCKFDCIIIPGITHLTNHSVPGLKVLAKSTSPAFALSASIWLPLPAAGYLLRSRVIFQRPAPAPDLSVARTFASPIGARDPYTYDLLRNSGIDTLYTGCASLLLPSDNVGDDGYILFSFGRGHVRAQVRAGIALAKKNHVVGICHEVDEYRQYRAAGWNLPLVTFRGDTDLYLSYFKRAKLVITGRLHGALPSLAFGKRVFYFGTRDTRTTILDDLGVPIHSYGEILTAPCRASDSFNRAVIPRFKHNWDNLMKCIEARCEGAT